jgi:hypothetical protein
MYLTAIWLTFSSSPTASNGSYSVCDNGAKYIPTVVKTDLMENISYRGKAIGKVLYFLLKK